MEYRENQTQSSKLMGTLLLMSRMALIGSNTGLCSFRKATHPHGGCCCERKGMRTGVRLPQTDLRTMKREKMLVPPWGLKKVARKEPHF